MQCILRLNQTFNILTCLQWKSTCEGLSCSWLISICYHCMIVLTRVLLLSRKHCFQHPLLEESLWMPFSHDGGHPCSSVMRIWSGTAFPSKPCGWAPMPPWLAWKRLSLLQICKQAVHLMPDAAATNVQRCCATLHLTKLLWVSTDSDHCQHSDWIVM